MVRGKFPDYDEKRFRQLVRCTKLQFDSILRSNGDGATIQKISCLFGIGDGGTINKITERIFEAILSLEPKYLTWPNSAERNTLVEKTMHELPYLVGYTDGTEIELVEAPKIDRDVYLSRNKIFALKLQTTIDYTKKVRHIVVGYPGSVHDARIFNECDLALNPRKYLTEPQWIGADSAYKLRTTLITPFRKNSKELTATARREFNRYFSTFRVRVEHMIGIMKEKLPSCKKLPVRIIDEKSNEFACTWIRVCCILHNILLPMYDKEDLQYTNYQPIRRDHYEGDDCSENEDDEDGQQK